MSDPILMVGFEWFYPRRQRLANTAAARHSQIALAHRILIIAFCMLRDSAEYREMGGDHFDQINPERTRNRLVRLSQRLGLEVILRPAERDVLQQITDSPKRNKRGRPCKCAERLIPCTHKV